MNHQHKTKTSSSLNLRPVVIPGLVRSQKLEPGVTHGSVGWKPGDKSVTIVSLSPASRVPPTRLSSSCQHNRKLDPQRTVMNSLQSKKSAIRTEGMKRVASVCISALVSLKAPKEQEQSQEEDGVERQLPVKLLDELIADGLLGVCAKSLSDFDVRFEIRYYIDKVLFYLSSMSQENRGRLLELGTMEVYIGILRTYDRSTTRENESALITVGTTLAALVAGDKKGQERFNSLGGLGLCGRIFVKLCKLREWNELMPLIHLIAQSLRDDMANVRLFIDICNTTKVCTGTTSDKLSYPSDNIVSKTINSAATSSSDIDPTKLATFSFLANCEGRDQPLYVESSCFGLAGLGVPSVFTGVAEYPEIVVRLYMAEFVLRLFTDAIRCGLEREYVEGMFSANMVQKAVCLLKTQQMYKTFNLQVSKTMRNYSNTL